MNEDSDFNIGKDTKLSSSYPAQSFLIGSPSDRFNLSKLYDESKKLFGNIYKNTKPVNEGSFEDLNIIIQRRNRTQSVSSDISVDESLPIERRSSFSERMLALQAQQKTANKFANYRTAVTSYYD